MVHAINTEFYCSCYNYCTCIQTLYFMLVIEFVTSLALLQVVTEHLGYHSVAPSQVLQTLYNWLLVLLRPLGRY